MNEQRLSRASRILEFVKNIGSHPAYIGVRINTGETLYGSLYWPLPGDREKDLMGRGRSILVKDTSLRIDENTIYMFTIDVGIGVYQFKIPYEQLDSVFILPSFESPLIDSPHHPQIKLSGFKGTFKSDILRLMLDHTTFTIARYGIKYRKVVEANYIDSYPHPSIFPVWLPFEPNHFLPIYYDQDYFDDKSSWSVLYKNSSSMRYMLSSKQVCAEGVLISGIISFFENTPKVTMEGAIWEICAITEDFTPAGELGSHGDWVLGAFKPSWLLNAKEVMERIGKPYRMFGDVLPVSVEIKGFGTKNNLFKIRIAAYMPEVEAPDVLSFGKEIILVSSNIQTGTVKKEPYEEIQKKLDEMNIGIHRIEAKTDKIIEYVQKIETSCDQIVHDLEEGGVKLKKEDKEELKTLADDLRKANQEQLTNFTNELIKLLRNPELQKEIERKVPKGLKSKVKETFSYITHILNELGIALGAAVTAEELLPRIEIIMHQISILNGINPALASTLILIPLITRKIKTMK